jgi:hypothetical protein
MRSSALIDNARSNLNISCVVSVFVHGHEEYHQLRRHSLLTHVLVVAIGNLMDRMSCVLVPPTVCPNRAC